MEVAFSFGIRFNLPSSGRAPFGLNTKTRGLIKDELMRSAQRDLKNRAEIDRLERENKRIEGQRERENMQLSGDITRLEHVTKKLNSFANCTLLMLACFYVFVLQFVFARL